MPRDLVGRDRRAEPGAVDDDAGVGFAARDEPRHRRGDVRIVDRLGAVGAEVVHRQAAAAQVVATASLRSATPVWSLPIATRPDVGDRRQRQRRLPTSRPSRTTVMRRSRSVSSASGVTCPPRRQRHRLAALQHPRVGFGDDARIVFIVSYVTLLALCPSCARRQSCIDQPTQIQTRVARAGRRDPRATSRDDLHLVVRAQGRLHVPVRPGARTWTATSRSTSWRVSSYAQGHDLVRRSAALKDLDTSLDGRDVVIVEDIVDTGLTLTTCRTSCARANPKSLRTACLLSKPSRRKVDVKVEYIGFTIEDQFVVGYGLDYAEQYRNLPYIGVLDS